MSIDDIVLSLNEGFAKVNAKYGTELRAYINPIIEEQRKQDAAADDQTEDAAPDDQTDEAAPDDQTDDAAADNQTDDAAPDDQTDDAAPDQTIDISIEGDNNTIIIGGDDVGDQTKEDTAPDMVGDNGERDPD